MSEIEERRRPVVHRHLTRACRFAGIRQRELCERCGIGWDHWRRVLQARAVLSDAQVKAAAALLTPWADEHSFPRDPHAIVTITPALLKAVEALRQERTR